MVMESVNMEKSTNGSIDEKSFDDGRSKRPEFFPCTTCGRYFTSRAMTVHKRTCLENEYCECSACRSEIKIKKWKTLENNSAVAIAKNASRRDPEKRKIKITPRMRDLLTGKAHTSKNSVDPSKLLTFKLVEDNSFIIDKMMAKNNSVFKTNENSAVDDIKYAPTETNTADNLHAEVSEKSCELETLSENTDHDCNRKLFCCFCKEHFYWESFGLHVIQHCETVQDNFLKCPNGACGRFFSQPALFLTHYLIHNSEHPLECSDCTCRDPTCTSFNRVMDEHGYAETEPFHCYICLACFNHPQTVINHMRLHSKERPFKCTECDRSFRQVGNLQRHITTHRGDRPYECLHCKKSFADPATLRNHERVHTKETPYKCVVCLRSFTQIGNLKRHLTLHMKNQQSSISLSSATKVNKSDENVSAIDNSMNNIKINMTVPKNISNHQASDYIINNMDSLCDINNKHRKNKQKKGKMKVFTCKICKKVYAWKHDLAVHFRTHTGEKPYKCNMCSKKFAQSGAVRIHKTRHHPVYD